MSGLYLYCLVPPECRPAGVRGIADETVVALDLHARVWAWAGPQERAPEVSVAAAERHNGVSLAALAAGVTPIPLRFGQWIADAAAARDALADAERLAAALDRVAGAAEYGVRVLDEAALREVPRERPTTGRAHLESLAARRRSAGAVRERSAPLLSALREAVGGLVREERAREDVRGVRTVLEVAHLVPREAETEYMSGVGALRRRFPALRFLFTGPWPPYSFAP